VYEGARAHTTAGAREGIVAVRVDLHEKHARVLFDRSRWHGDDVALAIDDMGYDAVLLSVIDGSCVHARSA
jgi:hypothetical protein